MDEVTAIASEFSQRAEMCTLADVARDAVQRNEMGAIHAIDAAMPSGDSHAI